MTWLHVFASRVRGWFGSRRLDADFDDELQAHLAMLVEENIGRGRRSPLGFSRACSSR